ncbi:hypothetical protein CYMTET_46249, partial [Cymbomonas tetramitiformis]
MEPKPHTLSSTIKTTNSSSHSSSYGAGGNPTDGPERTRVFRQQGEIPDVPEQTMNSPRNMTAPPGSSFHTSKQSVPARDTGTSQTRLTGLQGFPIQGAATLRRKRCAAEWSGPPPSAKAACISKASQGGPGTFQHQPQLNLRQEGDASEARKARENIPLSQRRAALKKANLSQNNVRSPRGDATAEAAATAGTTIMGTAAVTGAEEAAVRDPRNATARSGGGMQDSELGIRSQASPAETAPAAGAQQKSRASPADVQGPVVNPADREQITYTDPKVKRVQHPQEVQHLRQILSKASGCCIGALLSDEGVLQYCTSACPHSAAQRKLLRKQRKDRAARESAAAPQEEEQDTLVLQGIGIVPIRCNPPSDDSPVMYFLDPKSLRRGGAGMRLVQDVLTGGHGRPTLCFQAQIVLRLLLHAGLELISPLNVFLVDPKASRIMAWLHDPNVGAQ